MRGGSLGGGLRLAALAATSLSVIAPTARIYGYENIRRHIQKQGRSKKRGNFDAKINRHTRAPHENTREIARAQRQAERVAKNRRARYVQDAERYGYDGPLKPGVGYTRRGRKVAL